MKKIIHIDMDAFYASVEQRDNPALRGRPVIVGGAPGSRGVVASCSYEARKFGIHSAMPSGTASRLCPKAVFVPGRFEVYRQVSSCIHEIFYSYSDLVEPLSLDEAYIDVTENRKSMVSATKIAGEVRRRIRKETGLTASAGVSYNKFIAKVASDYRKPDGMTVVTPAMASGFLDSLPVRKFHGIGSATEKRLLAMGVTNGAELKRLDRDILVRCFGKAGAFYYDIVRGIDNRPVEPDRVRKSIGKERTFQTDMDDRNEMLSVLSSIADEVARILEKNETGGRTITVKVKYSDFVSVTRSLSINDSISTAPQMMEHVPLLLDRTEAGRKKVRLLGISISSLDSEDDIAGTERQLVLFPAC